ncbi:hypothetical protein VTN77DRAFT_3530 [Rasamsonia byssochlamydoides]|uniref:uncharacterized protein n=1 Tax=Rasamsonia byssochlamydoides TaxID=89139 RepID=UPI0037420944
MSLCSIWIIVGLVSAFISSTRTALNGVCPWLCKPSRLSSARLGFCSSRNLHVGSSLKNVPKRPSRSFSGCVAMKQTPTIPSPTGNISRSSSSIRSTRRMRSRGRTCSSSRRIASE